MTTCPTCGSPVTIHTSDEGTSCYEVATDSQASRNYFVISELCPKCGDYVQQDFELANRKVFTLTCQCGHQFKTENGMIPLLVLGEKRVSKERLEALEEVARAATAWADGRTKHFTIGPIADCPCSDCTLVAAVMRLESQP